jgi:hypothetical protein
VPNTATASGTDSFEPNPETVSDDATVEIVDPSLVFPEDDAVDFKNRDVWFKFVSKNPEDMLITQIEISWPNDVNGALTRIQLGDYTIWTGNEAGPTAIIFEIDFTGSESDRILEAFQKEKLRFTFENRPVADPDDVEYTFVVTFADGTDVSITTPTTTSFAAPLAATSKSISTTEQAVQTVEIQKTGSGNGTITAGDQTCGLDCSSLSIPYMDSGSVTMTAKPAKGSYFVGWVDQNGAVFESIHYPQPGDVIFARFDEVTK